MFDDDNGNRNDYEKTQGAKPQKFLFIGFSGNGTSYVKDRYNHCGGHK